MSNLIKIDYSINLDGVIENAKNIMPDTPRARCVSEPLDRLRDEIKQMAEKHQEGDLQAVEWFIKRYKLWKEKGGDDLSAT